MNRFIQSDLGPKRGSIFEFPDRKSTPRATAFFAREEMKILSRDDETAEWLLINNGAPYYKVEKGSDCALLCLKSSLQRRNQYISDSLQILLAAALKQLILEQI